MELMSFITKGMTYQPTKKDPVLVFRKGGFGFNYLNESSRNGFWSNVEKCQGIKIEAGDMSSKKNKNQGK